MRLRPLSCLLSLMLVCLPTAAHAQSSRAADIELEPVRRCHSTVRSAPRDSLRIANALLAAPSPRPAIEAGALTCRAIAENQLGQNSAVEASLAQLQQLAERADLPKRERQIVLFVTQSLLTERGESAQALPILRRLLDEATADGDVPQQVMVLTGLAALHSQGLADHAGALGYLDRAIALTETVSRSPHDGDAMLRYNRAYALMLLKRYGEGEVALLDAERMAQRVGGQDLLLNRIASHRAEIKRATGQLDAAEAGLKKVLSWQQRNDPQGQVVTLQRMARVALDRNNDDEAAALGNQAIALARQTAMVAEIRSTLELLFEIQTHRGDAAAALAIGRELRDMDKERTRDAALGRLAQLQTRADEAIGTQQTAAQIHQRRDRLLRNVALAGLLLAVGVAGWLAHRHRVQRRRLEALGRNDRLTGLHNRAEAERLLADSVLAAGDERRTALLRIDVEGFKEFNDRRGQHAGDQALRILADALREVADEHDVLARWGGRSLMVVRVDTTCEASAALAAHLQSRLSGLSLPGHASETLHVSVGVAPLPLFAHGDSSADDSLRAIDRCLQEVASLRRPGWAMLWGIGKASEVDVARVLRDPLHAAAQDQVILAGSGLQGWTGTVTAAPAHIS